MVNDTRCALCENANLRDLFTLSSIDVYDSPVRTRGSYTIAKCDDCGLVFVKERIGEKELEDIYEEGYYKGRIKKGYTDYDRQGKLRTCTLKNAFDALNKELYFIKRYGKGNRLRLLVSSLPRILDMVKPRSRNMDLINRYVTEPGRILDVGCAMGFFLVDARKAGWEVTGIEISEYSSACARKRFKLNILTGELGDLVRKNEIETGSFDVVTIWDTLEHVQDPSGLLKAVNQVLKEEGLLFISTLNIDSLVSKADGKDWHFFAPPMHLFYFSERTLKGFLRKAGFKVILDDDFRKDVVFVGAKKFVNSWEREIG